MLPKHMRIHGRTDIRNIYNKGKFIRSKDILIWYRINKSQDLRCIFVVSNKVSKKAVVRNKLRRQLRSIILLHRANLCNNYDIIIAARPSIVGKNFQEIKNELESALIRDKILSIK